MLHTQDVHKQFAEYFQVSELKPYLYLLSKRLSEGHICIDLGQIDHAELNDAGFKKMISKEDLKKEDLVGNATEWKPLILNNDHLYLQRYFNYETLILERIQEFIRQEKNEIQQRIAALNQQTAFIKSLFGSSGNPAIDWQLIATLSAVLNNFTIITGGPGTGKTTTVAKILAILFNHNPALKVALGAPTGKAAARMAESLKNAAGILPKDIKEKFETLEPSTIHRLLKSQKGSIYFKHNKANPIHFDVLIIDESSMIDVALFAKLLDAIGPETKIILLGDKDQLASVEAGSLFGDLCNAQRKLNLLSEGKARMFNDFIEDKSREITDEFIQPSNHSLFEHIIELRVSHRFSDEEGIGKFSKAIIQNKQNDLLAFFENKDERIQIDNHYSEKTFQEFIAGYRDYIEEKDVRIAFKKFNQLRVLCAIREGAQGLYALNRAVEKYLQEQQLLNISTDFYEHRPIIVTSNNYELNLFNGDIGIVRKNEKGELRVWFEDNKGEIRGILPAFIENAETVFAMTIHKSQGSEFDQVMVVLPNNEDIPILTRELLYTGVTRAKNKVWVQSSKSVLLKTAETLVKRGSGIIARF